MSRPPAIAVCVLAIAQLAFAQRERRPDAVVAPGKVTPLAEPYDPFKSSQADKLTPAQVVLVANASTTVSIAEMVCEVHQFSHDTRAVTCGLSGNQQSYSGVLIVHFADGSVWSRSVMVEQPLYADRMAAWGVATIPAYGSVEITKVEFSNGGVLADWDGTQYARDVLKGTYDYGKAAYYPPPVVIGEMMCHVSEFLVGKSQAPGTPTYTFTCVLAGDRQFYGGSVAVWWHQLESRLAAPGTPPPVPAQYSTRDTAQHTAYVRVAHDVIGANMSYWGLAAFAIESPYRIAYDRMQFYPEREEVSFSADADVPQKAYTAPRHCRALPVLCKGRKKPYLR